MLSRLFSRKKVAEKQQETTPNPSSHRSPSAPTGMVQVDGLFWDCLVNDSEKKVDILHKEKMGSSTIAVLATDGDLDMVWKATQQITAAVLAGYLERKGIRQFIPLKKPSFVWAGEILEVCYYHDHAFYERKYGQLNEGYIMQNNDPALNARMEELCRFYALNQVI
jgi:hypothetical protein